MTRLSTRAREEYSTVGQSTFAYQFQIYDAAELRVIKTSSANVASVLSLGSDYSVTGAGNLAGGTVTLLAGPLASGERLTIELAAPHTQTTDIRNTGDFQPAVHELAFDRLAEQVQQIARVVGTTPDDAEALRLGYPRSDGSRRYDANGQIIEMVGDAVNAQDAVNLRALEAYVGSFVEGGTAVFPGFFQILGDNVTVQYLLPLAMTGAVNEIFLLVAINGVLQEPGEAYTYDPATQYITFPTPLGTGARCWIVQLGYARGVAVPPLYTSEGSIPAAASGYAGREIRVKLPGAPEERRVCMQKADGTWAWQTSVVAPPF